MSRIIVTGGRDFTDREYVFASMHLVIHHATKQDIELVATGDATGVDDLVREWCRGNFIPYRRYAADWGAFGKSAGPRRNRRMLEEVRPSLVVEFPGGRGTANMVSIAMKAGVPIRMFEGPDYARCERIPPKGIIVP